MTDRQMDKKGDYYRAPANFAGPELFSFCEKMLGKKYILYKTT